MQQNLNQVRQKIATALQQYGRPIDAVKLLAVSKGQSTEKIRAAYAAGQYSFGENYWQESLLKMQELADLHIEWHFIGHIQTNKAAHIAQKFDWVQTVCSIAMAERLSRHRPPELAPLNICIQVNISGEASKDGLAPTSVLACARAIQSLPRLRLRGLMAIPAPADDFIAQRIPCAQLHQLFDALNQDGMKLDTLSVGMSADMEAAIAEGATLVRVGTSIFGSRADQRILGVTK
jgi:pyridoxal phosphate enzyme (YggS family)